MKNNKENQEKIAEAMTPFVRTYIIADAAAQAMRSVVDDIANNILLGKEYLVNEGFEQKNNPGERITDHKNAWMMSNSDSHEYLTLLRDALISEGLEAHGIEGQPYYSYKCPALSLESLKVDAEHLLIQEAGKHLGKPGDDFLHMLLCAGLDKYHEFIKLICDMVVAYQPVSWLESIANKEALFMELQGQ